MDFERAISRNEAETWVNRISLLTDEDFSNLKAQWRLFQIDLEEAYEKFPNGELPEGYGELRRVLLEEFKRGRNDYQRDLLCGLALYSFLNNVGFTEACAENDDFWRYLTIAICPDITYLRYPSREAERINLKRFYSHTRRIWLKTLWWFVHLSWQGTVDKTYEVLSKFSTDSISQLIERTGAGYRKDVTRAIMARCSLDNSSATFKKIMARHLIYLATLEPCLVEGGLSGYARDLVEKTKAGKGL